MSGDHLPLRRVDHIKFIVGNARQSAYFYRNAFGFDVTAYAGLETGMREEVGTALKTLRWRWTRWPMPMKPR